MDAFPDTMVLLAATPENAPVLLRMLDGVARAWLTYTEEEALKLAGPAAGLVICTMRFAESRTLHFVAQALQRFPRLRWICCRVSEGELPPSCVHAAQVAAANLGAVAFVDLPAWSASYGDEGAAARFRALVSRELSA